MPGGGDGPTDTARLALGRTIFRLYARALAYPLFLKLAPEKVPPLIESASTEAELFPDAPPRQVLELAFRNGPAARFVATNEPSSLLRSGALARARLELSLDGIRTMSLAIEPEAGPGQVAAIVSDAPGAWEDWIRRWAEQEP